jgi:hypothetical protein
MIIVNISGSIGQQLSQYAFGLACAAHLETGLKLDVSSNPLLLDGLVSNVDVANGDEVAGAKHKGQFEEEKIPFDDSIWVRVKDGTYLSGLWTDYRYSKHILPILRDLMGHAPLLTDQAVGLLDAIGASVSVAIDLRAGHAVPPPIYFNDAIAEVHERLPEAHLFVFCDDNADLRSYEFGDRYSLVKPMPALTDAEVIVLMSACKHHIVGDQDESFWAAILDAKRDALVIAPQQIFKSNSALGQPIWPSHWIVFPTRVVKPQAERHVAVDFIGGTSIKRPMRVAVTNFYERYTTDGYLFKNPTVPNGHNSLQPWCDLYDYGQANGIEFVTLDQVANIETDLDAVIFTECPKLGHRLTDAAMKADIFKILLIYECPLIKPDNWDIEFHKQFDLIFTWGDQLIDGRRYIKSNFVTSLELPYDFEVLKSAFLQRKLVTMINSAVVLQEAYASQFPTELYTHRIRSIRWFEANASHDFDLYGLGWDINQFPSYKGRVRDKLATLSHYRFAICYENAQNYPGYISEKIQDCLLAGVVPVYGGAPNIERWIPSDCYIDIRQFQSYDALYAHLANMDAATHGQYLDRIHNFFILGKAYPFSTECFITTLTKFLTWGVQAKRGDVPELATNNANVQTHCLEQDVNTLEVKVVPKVVSLPVAAVSSVATIRQSMAELKRDDLIVTLGYGPELPVFLRARSIWQLYASHFSRLKIIFMRWSEKLPLGEIVTEGNDLVIGVGSSSESTSESDSVGYADRGVWSETENERTVFRQMVLYDYLLRKYQHPFHLFASTITSIIDFRGLIAVLDNMPRERCFAGMPGRLVHPSYQGVGIVHGANTLVSRDVMEMMRSRYVSGHEFTKQPNDHWQGLVLGDLTRTALPLFSFNAPQVVGGELDGIKYLTKKLLAEGHYHFRVKTTSSESGSGNREDVDPWIMLKIVEVILGFESLPEKYKLMQQRFALCCEPDSKYKRDFPIDDLEAAMLYRLTN